MHFKKDELTHEQKKGSNRMQGEREEEKEREKEKYSMIFDDFQDFLVF